MHYTKATDGSPIIPLKVHLSYRWSHFITGIHCLEHASTTNWQELCFLALTMIQITRWERILNFPCLTQGTWGITGRKYGICHLGVWNNFWWRTSVDVWAKTAQRERPDAWGCVLPWWRMGTWKSWCVNNLDLASLPWKFLAQNFVSILVLFLTVKWLLSNPNPYYVAQNFPVLTLIESLRFSQVLFWVSVMLHNLEIWARHKISLPFYLRNGAFYLPPNCQGSECSCCKCRVSFFIFYANSVWCSVLKTTN